MEKINFFVLALVLVSFASCKQETSTPNEKQETTGPYANSEKTVKQLKEERMAKGYQIFDYVDEETKDTVLMQQYFIAFLKSGQNRTQSKKVADSLQALHLEHLGRMYKLGYADISGPFGDDGTIRGITVYNTPTLAMADSLANMDPMVQAGRLEIEMHPWWAAKGYGLR